MFKKSMFFVLACFVLFAAMSITAVAAQSSDLGSADNPIEVVFVPSVDAGVITTGGQVLADALNRATGLNFKVSVTPSYAATIEEMCANPDKTIGFIPAAGYVIANNRCGVQVAAKAVRNGFSVYWTQYIVKRDSDIYTFGDLAGKKWGYGDVASGSGYLVPAVEMQNAGIVPGDKVATGGHGQTVTAVYNGDVDFGTTFYSPPNMGDGHAAWQIGDLPEPFDLSTTESTVTHTTNSKGADVAHLMVGGIEVLDARDLVAGTTPDILDKVRVLRLSDPIPNDTMSFSPNFPADVQQKVMDAIFAFAKTDDWKSSIGSPQFYAWSGIVPATDAEYAIVHGWFSVLGLTDDDILNPPKK